MIETKKFSIFSSYKPLETHDFQMGTTLRRSGQNFIEIQQPDQFLWSFIFDGSDLTRHVSKGLITTPANRISIQMITTGIKNMNLQLSWLNEWGNSFIDKGTKC